MKLIFGPVLSRRFGNSLGVDLSPGAKQCNFDCIYCELSPAKVLDKQEYVVKVEDVISQLKSYINDDIDVITLTANGEPTLYPYLDELIDKIDKIKNNSKTLILSNSSTICDENVFNALLKLDKVKLSLDAITPNIFKKIDRASKQIDITKIVECMKNFSKQFRGELYIEILLVKGINDKKEEIEKLNKVLLEFENITRIDLSTIDRPPAYDVKPLSFENLHVISLMFDKKLPIHIASRKHISNKSKRHLLKDEILNTLEKRPLTWEDIDLLYDKKTKESINSLLKEGKITIKKVSNLEFIVNSFL